MPEPGALSGSALTFWAFLLVDYFNRHFLLVLLGKSLLHFGVRPLADGPAELVAFGQQKPLHVLMWAGTLCSLSSCHSDSATTSQRPRGICSARGGHRGTFENPGCHCDAGDAGRSGGCAVRWATGWNTLLVSGGAQCGCYGAGGGPPCPLGVFVIAGGPVGVTRFTHLLLSGQTCPGSGHELPAGAAGSEVPHRGGRLSQLSRAPRNAGAGGRRAGCGEVRGGGTGLGSCSGNHGLSCCQKQKNGQRLEPVCCGTG